MLDFKAKILMNEWRVKNKQSPNRVITKEDYDEAAQETVNRLAENIADYALEVIRWSPGPVVNIEYLIGKNIELARTLAFAFCKHGFAVSYYRRGEDYILAISLEDGRMFC